MVLEIVCNMVLGALDTAVASVKRDLIKASSMCEESVCWRGGTSSTLRIEIASGWLTNAIYV